MTKRRAENGLPPELPNKRSLRSLSNNDDTPVDGVTVGQNGGSLLLSVGPRKRPNHTEDSTKTRVTDDVTRKSSPKRKRNTCKSGTFPDVMLKEESKNTRKEQNEANKGDKVMHSDEELSAFNTFQFWRVPLPEVDLSLLEPTDEPVTAVSTKDLEAMET